MRIIMGKVVLFQQMLPIMVLYMHHEWEVKKLPGAPFTFLLPEAISYAHCPRIVM
jgi:hypothetical protein